MTNPHPPLHTQSLELEQLRRELQRELDTLRRHTHEDVTRLDREMLRNLRWMCGTVGAISTIMLCVFILMIGLLAR